VNAGCARNVQEPRGAGAGRVDAAQVFGRGAPLARLLPDQVLLQDRLAHGLLVQERRAPLWPRARERHGRRSGEVRLPFWARLSGRPPK